MSFEHFQLAFLAVFGTPILSIAYVWLALHILAAVVLPLYTVAQALWRGARQRP